MLNKVRWCPDHGRMKVMGGEINISNPHKWQEILEDSGIPYEHVMCSICGSERFAYGQGQSMSSAQSHTVVHGAVDNF